MFDSSDDCWLAIDFPLELRFTPLPRNHRVVVVRANMLYWNGVLFDLSDVGKRMPRARIRLRPSHHRLAAFSKRYPDDEFRMLTVYPADEGLFVLVDARTDAVDDLVDHLDQAATALDYEVLHTDAHGVVVQLLIPEPDPHQAALASRNMPSSPLIVRDGWIYSEMTSSRERIAKFRDELEGAGVTYELLSIESSRTPQAFLTERQHQFVTEALERGYYEEPRRTSLTELAASMDVDKSTASRILRKAEGMVISEFFATARSGW